MRMKQFNASAISRAVMRQFNSAFALMSVIPVLVCCYLITVKFFSFEILMGINGVYVLMAVVFAMLGLAAGRQAIGHIIQQLSEGHAKTERLVTELAGVNERLTQELEHRTQAERALKEEKAALEDMNKVMMNREDRILEIKKEVNELHKEFGRPPRYEL